MKEGCEDTEDDLDNLIEIISKTDPIANRQRLKAEGFEAFSAHYDAECN